MRDGIFHSSGLAIVAAGGGAGVITRPFQLVDQRSGSGGEEGESNKGLGELEYEPCQSTWGKFHSCWW